MITFKSFLDFICIVLGVLCAILGITMNSMVALIGGGIGFLWFLKVKAVQDK